MAPVKRKATYADVEKLPEHLVGEILDGELFVSPRPALRHARVASILGGQVLPFDRAGGGGSREPGGWVVLDEPELHVGHDVLVPDLAGWRRERLPRLPDAPFMKLAPDWVCEIVSPATGRIDRGRKMRIYAREKVAHLWMIDPSAQTLEVYRLAERKRWLLLETYEGKRKVRAEPFTSLDLDMGRWWIEE